MKNLWKTLAGAAGLIAVVQAQTIKPSVPREPIAAILDAFRSHSIVAIGDVHGNEQLHAFRLSLIREPRFAATVNDIVVEFGSARYQDAMDRYVRGEEVPYESLRGAWQNTTQPEYEWDLPIYEEFFRTVRAVNASLPRERQLRVLLGDPPIDWDSVKSRADLGPWLDDRDAHAARVIRREVLEKGRRALVIYGSQHLGRKNTAMGAAEEWAGGLVGQLERPSITNVFTINPESRRDLKALQSDAGSWPRPSLAVLKGTQLGAANVESGPQQRAVRMEEQFDAVLYLGPPSTMTVAKLSPALCADRGYMEMRLGRLAIIAPPPGAPFLPADRLREYCANPAGNAEIADSKPKFAELIRQTLRDAAQGKVDPAGIAPESRDRLIPFLQNIGTRFLGPAGALESLTLLADTSDAEKRVRRYRAVFASGQKMILTVSLSSTDTILSLDPRPE